MTDFNVEIVADMDANKCSASAVGQQIHTITDVEAKAFGFDDWAKIQRACGTIIGEAPDEWFLHNPTMPHPNPGDRKYDNAYSVFGWPEVTTVLRPVNAEFLGVNTQPVIVNHVEWVNDTDHSVHYHADMSVTEAESVSHSISNSSTFGTSATIGFKVGIEGFGDVSGEQSFTFTKEWGETDTNTQEITVGVISGADDDVLAHTTETAYLWSNLGSAKFRVTYQVSLDGLLMALNNHWYEGHIYRGLNPGEVLREAGLPTVVSIEYEHTVGFYSDARIHVMPGPYDPTQPLPNDLLSHLIVLGVVS